MTNTVQIEEKRDVTLPLLASTAVPVLSALSMTAIVVAHIWMHMPWFAEALVILSGIAISILASASILDIASILNTTSRQPEATGSHILHSIRDLYSPATFIILLPIGAVTIVSSSGSIRFDNNLLILYLLFYLPLGAAVACVEKSTIRSILFIACLISFIFAAFEIAPSDLPYFGPIFLLLIGSTMYILNGLANKIRNGIEIRASLQAKAQASADLWSSIAQHARKISALESQDKILSEVVAATATLGFELASICLLNKLDKKLRFTYSRGLPRRITNKEHQMARLASSILDNRNSVVIDFSTMTDSVSGLREIGLRTTVAIPLWVHGEITGLLGVGSRLVREVGTEELAALELLAVTAGSALEQRALTSALIADVTRLREVLENSPGAVLVVDEEGSIIIANRRAGLLFGYENLELLNKTLTDIVHLEKDWHIPVWNSSSTHFPKPRETSIIRSDGSSLEVELAATRLQVAERKLLSVTVRDLTEQRIREARLLDDATRDMATGLPNASKFVDIVRKALARGTSHHKSIMVAVIEVDRNLRSRRQNLHISTDDYMELLAKTIEGSIRPQDTLARIDIDKFALLAERISAPSALHYARQLRDHSALVVKDGKSVPSAFPAFGIAFAALGEDAETLIRNAQLAITRAKDAGDSSIAFYDETITARASTRLQAEADLNGAGERGEFNLLYQPIVSLEDGHTEFVEALIRWNHPHQGTILPSLFIPIAEDTGVIKTIGEWTIRESCNDYLSWANALGKNPDFKVSINVSQRQLLPKLIVSTMRDIIQSSQLPPSSFMVEITETALLTDIESANDTLVQLSDLGVTIAIDDFGTGYSSLSMLTSLPVNILKIDKSFVDQLGTRSDITVDAIIRLAKQLNMAVIAEGVENTDQVHQLVELGCQFAQGYLFSRPIESSAIPGFIHKSTPKSNT